MRKFVLTGIFAFMMVMTACSDKPVAAEQVPEPIKVFVQQMFPGQTITYAEKDQEVTGAKYDVVLTDGTRIDFDADDVWDKVEATMANPVPTALVPAPIVTYIQSNFPDAMILKIDKEHNGYGVELSNGKEIKFNRNFQAIDVDYDD